eukprot:COSAG05_NODE_19971_length_285_cov_29116.956757_1_plen_60_part_10
MFYILCAYCCRCRPHPTVAIPPYTPVARCCLDPVAGASRVLMSVDAGARVRGLETLRALP